MSVVVAEKICMGDVGGGGEELPMSSYIGIREGWVRLVGMDGG